MSKIAIRDMNSSYMRQMDMLLEEELEHLKTWNPKGFDWAAFYTCLLRIKRRNEDKVQITDKASKKYTFSLDVVDAFVMRDYFQTHALPSTKHPYLDYVYNQLLEQIDRI